MRHPLTPWSRGFDCSHQPCVFQLILLRERGGGGGLGVLVGTLVEFFFQITVNIRGQFVISYQSPREASSRSRIFLNSLVYLCMYLCIYLSICVTSPAQTKNDTDLKFGTHIPIDLI